MKTSSKTILSTALLASFILTPVFAFAAERKEKPLGGAFCSRIDTVAAKLGENLGKRTENVTTKKTERLAKLAEERLKRDEKRAGAWASHDTSRDARFDALTNRADTDAKKAAVVAFEAAMKAAVSARRTAVDTAVKNYRTGVDALVNGKMTSLDGGVTTLKQAIDAAIATAKTSCATTGANGETIRTTMTASIKAAQELFKKNRTDAAIKDQLTALATTRKAAVDTAINQFKTDTAKAAADLKAVFGAK